MTPTPLTHLNALDETAAYQALQRCCGSLSWVQAVANARPFASEGALMDASERAFNALTPQDWLEAFAHHPRIGDVDALRAKFSTLSATKAWAGDEQAGARGAADETLHALAQGNHDYEARFGYLFIVCATGKTAVEMLALLQARLSNTPQAELPIAAEQQKQITRLRLQKLLDS